MHEQLPPQNLQAEQSALGAMLLERDAVEAAVEMLTPADFYREAHGTIYRGIMQLFLQGVPVDLTTLGEWLQAHGELDGVGGGAYLAQCMQVTPTAAGIRTYCRIIKAKSTQRRLIKAADAIQQAAYADVDVADLPTLVQDAEARMMEISDEASTDRLELVSMYDLERDVIAERRRRDAAGLEDGFKPPLSTLNHLVEAITPQMLVLLAGRPGAGKSAFLLQWAYHAARVQDRRGLFVTIEMSKEQLGLRRLLAGTELTRWCVTNLHYRTANARTIYPKLESAAEESRGMPLMILDLPNARPDDIQAAARRAKSLMGGLDFIMVDYLQKMSDNRNSRELIARVTELAKEMKSLAKRMNCAVIAVSSLNRENKRDGHQRPELHHLRESGQLDFEADTVIMLHTPDEADPRRVEIGVVKQREGACGWQEVGYCPKLTWFYGTPDDVPTV